MSYQFKKKSRGFVGVIFLAVALIGIVISAISAMSRSSSSGTATEQARTNVAVLLKQTSDFKTGFDRMVVSGVDQNSVTLDDAIGTGLFDPTPGAQYAVKHLPPTAITEGELPTDPAKFYQSRNVIIPGIGSDTSSEFLATAFIKDLQTCQMINKMLYNDLTTAIPATSGAGRSAWTDLGTPTDDSGISAVNYLGRPEGCVKIGAGDPGYVYYKALSEN